MATLGATPFADWRPSGEVFAISTSWAVAAGCYMFAMNPSDGLIGHPAATHLGPPHSPLPMTSALRCSKLLLTNGFPAGLPWSTERQQKLPQCRLFFLNVFLYLWLGRWFLFCFICHLSSLACMLKLALRLHFNPSLVLMQTAMQEYEKRNQILMLCDPTGDGLKITFFLIYYGNSSCMSEDTRYYLKHPIQTRKLSCLCCTLSKQRQANGVLCKWGTCWIECILVLFIYLHFFFARAIQSPLSLYKGPLYWACGGWEQV